MHYFFPFAICCNNVLIIRLKVMVTQYIFADGLAKQLTGKNV